MRVDADLKPYVGAGNAARACDVLALLVTEQRKFNAEVQSKLERIVEVATDLRDRIQLLVSNNSNLRPDSHPPRNPVARNPVDRVRKRAKF